MLSFLNGLRELSAFSVALRMLLAVLCGGLIGLEREFKRRPAGFRTHILICLGAAITTLTSQFLYLYMHYYTDMTRLGAQVIAGIGFIGAGTIITRRERVKGLTTAAGLWASAIVGLAIGAGFYEGAVIATVLIILAEWIFARLEYWLLDNAPEANLYIEYENKSVLGNILEYFRQKNIKIVNLEITRSKTTAKHNACAIVNLRMDSNTKISEVTNKLELTEGVIHVEEL